MAMSEAPLIHADGHVLAAIDPSVYATSVADHAAWAARRLGAPLELLRTLEKTVTTPVLDLSGTIALGTQEALLGELAELDARRMAIAQEHGRALLEGLSRRVAEAHGISADTRQRHGALVETLLEMEPGVRLFVIGKRGEQADFARGHLGSNLERVVRAVHRPVLVASRMFKAPARFVIAYDGSATTRAHLDWACTRLQAAGFAPRAHLAAGDAERVVVRHVESLNADLLIAGAYGHSRIRSMILGSTTTQLLQQCRIPVLLLR
jgi:nucleotide-binding universal stress UspA family protein